MEHRVKMTVAILLLGIAQGVMADGAVTPNDRAAAPQTDQGMRFVRVMAISGRDDSGQEQLLFTDRDGALLPLDEINQAGRLIDPTRLTPQGNYGELRLQLAEQMLVVDAQGIQYQPLPHGVAPTQRLALLKN